MRRVWAYDDLADLTGFDLDVRVVERDLVLELIGRQGSTVQLRGEMCELPDMNRLLGAALAVARRVCRDEDVRRATSRYHAVMSEVSCWESPSRISLSLVISYTSNR